MLTWTKRLMDGILHHGRMEKSQKRSPLLGYLDPADLASPDKLLRLGTRYGGWIVPAAHGLGPSSVCYLAGAGEDISFDCALASRFGSKVRIVDPTPRAVSHFQKLAAAVSSGEPFPINNSATDFYELSKDALADLTFIDVGLANEDTDMKFYLPQNKDHVSCSTANLQHTEEYFWAKCCRLATLMQQQGDETIDLLKMDIEGAEYAVLEDIVVSNLLPRMLLVEFDEAHTPFDSDAESRIARHFRLLADAGMRCIAAEGPNATFVRK